MAVRIALVLVLVAPAIARADHDHAPHDRGGPFGVAVGLVAASYDQMLFEGDYQGVVPSARWAGTRFATSVTLPLYRLVENGRTVYGAGDVSGAVQVTVLERHAWSAGGALHVMLPSGNHETGLGMGHVMAMPAVWARAKIDRVGVTGSLGYGRALGGAAAHDHGAWPIVDPMTRSEVMAALGADVALTPALRAGVRVGGALALRGEDDHRMTAGARAEWTAGRVATSVELQAGLVGDPFTLRGVVETALSF